MKRIVSVTTLPAHRLRLRFDDGVEGEVSLAAEVGHGVFEAWRDPKHFGSVAIEPDGRALVWPGEIDLCADSLYLEVTGLKPEDLFPRLKTTPIHA